MRKRKKRGYYLHLIVYFDYRGFPLYSFGLIKNGRVETGIRAREETYLYRGLKALFLWGKRIVPNSDSEVVLEVKLTPREAKVFKKIASSKEIRRKWSLWRDILKEERPLRKLEEELPKFVLKENLEK